MGGYDRTAWQAINTGDVLSPEEWYNVAVTQDNSEARIYVNGNLEDSLDTEFAYSAAETGISIGTHKWASANFFDGIIDEALFYGRVLDEAEIKKNSDSLGAAVAYSYNKIST